METETILGAIAVGAGATLVMDIWAIFLRRAFNIPSFDFRLVGRWFSHMLDGTFRHASITAAPQRPAESALGWSAHYVIGIAYAFLVLLVASADWLARPTPGPALAVGVGTVLVPFFVMQPALGLGVAAANAPKPVQARLKSVMTHTVFGLGLYGSALLWSSLR